MAKQGGMGDALYVGGYDLSGDTNSLGKISGGPKPWDVTDITQSGRARIGLERDGTLDWVSYFNTATNRAHARLSLLPTADVGVQYSRGAILGNPAACMIGKEINYAPKRDKAGGLLFAVTAQANGFGLEWGTQLTAGLRTDVAATNGTGVDQTIVSTAFGWQAYLQVSAFTGTDVTVKIQDSADNVTFADLTGAAFTQVTSGTPQTQRLAGALTATVRRYVRAITITSGGVTSVSFAVVFVRNEFLSVAF